LKITLDYDAALNVLFTSYPGVRLQTAEEVDQFFQVIENKLKTIPHKVYVVADLQNFEVDARIAEAFGEKMAQMHEKYVIALLRYNLIDGFPRLSIRLASLKAGRPARIVNNREEALAEVRHLQTEAAKELSKK
jgi:hypothetical protein